MTDNVVSADVQSNVNVGSSDNSQSISSSPAPVEKTFTQADVDRLIKTNKHISYEKGKKDALAEYQTSSSTSQPEQINVQSQPQTGVALTQEQIKQAVTELVKPVLNETLEQRQYEQQLQTYVGSFANKINAGKNKYSDFDEVVGGNDEIVNMVGKNQNLMFLLNDVDNTTDVLYEISKNPHKKATILALAAMGSYNDAAREISRISSSIKANEGAADYKRPNEPLSQLKPSQIGADSGKRTISELRKDPKLKA